MVTRAREGDAMVGQWLLSRILPSARSAPLAASLELPVAPGAAADEVLHRLADGLLTLDEAKALLDAIEVAQRIAEGSVLADRIQAIESKLELLGDPNAE
jgi:prophage antirepressor-like protein